MANPTFRQVQVADVACGVGVTIIQPSNLYGCSLGDGAFVGPFVEIQKGVTIGARTKIQSHSFICELVAVGDDCFIGHGVMFINDTFASGGPAGGDRSRWRRTTIANHVSIGSGATLLPISVCSNVVIGAGAVVTNDIVKAGVYAGNPARLIREL